MCEITNCRDLIEARDRFEKLKVHLEDENPKIYKALKPLLDEVQVFMTSARFHIDDLYRGVRKVETNTEKIKSGNLKISFGE